MNKFLRDILDARLARVVEQKSSVDVEKLSDAGRQARRGSRPYRLQEVLSVGTGTNIIAEFKRASPSKGVINTDVDPAEVARQYEAGGACAISVLTEENFFRGSLDDLRAVRSATSLPVLRKDFVVDEFQIHEAAVAGADAILLIVAALELNQLERFMRLATEDLKMDAVVEVHTVEEMKTAASIGAKIIGVNNRDLKTFDVSLDVSRKLVDLAPSDTLLISESGLRNSDEIRELKGLGYSGFLIGETLMKHQDPSQALRMMRADSV